MPFQEGITRRLTVVAAVLLATSLVACRCVEPPYEPVIMLFPYHNATNVSEVIFDWMDMRAEEAIEALAEDLQVLGPDRQPVKVTFRIEAYERDPWIHYLVVDGLDVPGWYTFRLPIRQDQIYMSYGSLEVDGHLERDLLVGVMEPGIRHLWLGGALDGLGDATITIRYSEKVRHDANAEDMFELLDSDGEVVSCGAYVNVPLPDETPPLVWPEEDPSGPEMPGRSLFKLQCDGERSMDILAIRVVDPPWSDDLSVRASFPPEGEVWTMDLIQHIPDHPRAREWRPDRRGFSEHLYGTQTNEPGSSVTGGPEAPPTGCGAQSAGGDHSSAAAVLLLVFMPLLALRPVLGAERPRRSLATARSSRWRCPGPSMRWCFPRITLGVVSLVRCQGLRWSGTSLVGGLRALPVGNSGRAKRQPDNRMRGTRDFVGSRPSACEAHARCQGLRWFAPKTTNRPR